MGTVAAPLLAGFALTTVVVLVTTSTVKTMPLYEWGVVLFSLAGMLFVFTVQFTYMGLMYAASPSERVDWLPHAAGQEPDDETYATATRIQVMDLALQERYFTRAGRLYALGILSYTAGLGLIVIPHDWDVARGMVVAMLTIAFALEVVWFVSTLLGRRVQWLLPGYASLIDDSGAGDSGAGDSGAGDSGADSGVDDRAAGSQ
jgi:hypothetical protein